MAHPDRPAGKQVGVASSARRLVVQGRVQGVFFRDWTVGAAHRLGLAGWVRNLPDGTVEVHLEGDKAAVEQMIAALHEGPPRARVDAIDSSAAQAEGRGGFERR